MATHKPNKNRNKFLITERSLNYILRPVQVRKENYPYTYRIKNMDEEIPVTIDRAWTPYNHLVLDFIGNELHAKEYKKIEEKKRKTWKNEGSQRLLSAANGLLRYSDRDKMIKDELKPLIPKYSEYLSLDHLYKKLCDLNYRNELSKDEAENYRLQIQRRQELLQELQFFLDDLNNVKDLALGYATMPYKFEFNINSLLDRYHKFFIERRKEYFSKLIKKTSEVRFTFEYPLRVPVIVQIDKDGKKQSLIKGVSLQNIKIENDILYSAEIDGDDVKVTFNTFLGRAYLHNILTLNTDWFEEDFLKLDGYASAIYRRFFVTRSGNKFDQLPIKEFVDYFDLLQNSHYPKVLEKAFEDIKGAGLIDDYKFVANGGKFSKGYIEVVKSSK